MDRYDELARQLVAAGKQLYDMQMVPATSGNFSARIDAGELAITVSGRHKGRLTIDDIMRINLAGESLDGKKPSAETGLHTQIYRRYPEIQAVLHAHSLYATLISRTDRPYVELKNYELLKAFPGISSHDVSVTVPIFDNDQDITRLADKVDTYMANNEMCPVYLIRGHGFYTWGNSLDNTLNYIEALEFLFKCELTAEGVNIP